MPFIIYPYLLSETWVFDDERTGLKQEAFVLGASEMISRVVGTKDIPTAEKGFSLTFSDTPFDGHDVELQWVRAEEPESGLPGNWYSGSVVGELMEGWLCPALLLYFQAPPPRLFVRADPLPAGVDPIWHVSSDDPQQRRFMSAGDE